MIIFKVAYIHVSIIYKNIRIEKQNACQIALLINKSVNLIRSAFLIFKFNLEINELGNT